MPINNPIPLIAVNNMYAKFEKNPWINTQVIDRKWWARTDGRTDGRTDRRTDTEGYNIIPRHTLWRGIKRPKQWRLHCRASLLTTVNDLKFLTAAGPPFYFCSLIKCWFSGLEFTTGKTLIRLHSSLHCLSRPFWQATCVWNLRTFTVTNNAKPNQARRLLNFFHAQLSWAKNLPCS